MYSRLKIYFNQHLPVGFVPLGGPIKTYFLCALLVYLFFSMCLGRILEWSPSTEYTSFFSQSLPNSADISYNFLQ